MQSGDGKPFDLLAQYSNFGLSRKISLRDSASMSAFGEFAGTQLKRAMTDSRLLHGQRAEAMFEALLVALDQITLMKPEDLGRLHPAEGFRAPDFRVVLKDGRQWLIEVKNVYEVEAFAQRRELMSRTYREEMEAYAAATGGELKLAIFWARWGLWTLVTPRDLVDDAGVLTIDMQSAMMVNELGELGDRMIGLKPPLQIRLGMDQEKTSPIASNGEVVASIGSTEIRCADVLLTDKRDQGFAWLFMQYGQWEEEGPLAQTVGDSLEAIEFRWAPPEPEDESDRLQEDQGFHVVGLLSRMFARYWSEHTVEDQKVIQLRAPPRPGWLKPLVELEKHDGALSIWTFKIEPNPAALKAIVTDPGKRPANSSVEA